MRADLVWWHTFAPVWNGTFPILPPSPGPDTGPSLSTDSSRWGMGPVWGGAWWSTSWPAAVDSVAHPSMTLLEFLPVLVAAVVWDRHWRGQRVVLWSDNMGVVGSWRRG